MASGFNLLRLKKENQEKITKCYYRHVVVGDDLFSLATIDKLINAGENSVVWICPRKLEVKDLLSSGPCTLRGQKNITQFKEVYPDVELEISDENPLFFKELKWRKFGGRAKSGPLLWGEEFYVKEKALFDYGDIFPFIKDEERFKAIVDTCMHVDISGLLKETPDDLAEPTNFKLRVSNGDEVLCEHLYWGRGPESFIRNYDNLDDLSSGFIEFCESTSTPTSLLIKMVYEKPVADKLETLFIPLSYTHEWGHFIGEFKSGNNGEQVGEFVAFLDKSSCTEEDISKKIRLLKRNLEKIFPCSSSLLREEFIKLSDGTACLNVDDHAFFSSESIPNSLHFISVNAPVRESLSDHSNDADSLNVLSSIARGAVAGQNTLSSL